MAKKTGTKKEKKSAKKNTNEIPLEETPQETEPDELDLQTLRATEWLERYPRTDDQKKRWLYAGVGGFALLIGIMWLVSIKVQMSALSKRKTTESNLFSKTKDDWDAIFAERDKKTSEQSIKTALNQALAALAAMPIKTPTTTTGTVDNATSTPKTTTTTLTH